MASVPPASHRAATRCIITSTGPPETLIAYTGSNDTSNIVFTLTVDAVSGTYNFTELQPLDAFSIVNIGGSLAVPSGPVSSLIFTSRENGTGTQLAEISGWHADSAFNLENWRHAELGSATAGISLHSINGSSVGFGVDSNNFNQGDIIRFDFGSGALRDYDGAGPYVAAIGILANVTSATFSFSKAATIDYVVHYTDGDFQLQLHLWCKQCRTFELWHKIHRLHRILFGRERRKVSLTDTTTANNNGTTSLSFSVSVTDSDRDTTAAGTIEIVIDGDHTLTATAGVSNVIAGGASADTLVGTPAPIPL